MPINFKANQSESIRISPKEINDARSELWPLYKAERNKHPNLAVYIGFPAKLVVGYRIVKDLFPDWREVLSMSRCSSGKTPMPRDAQVRDSAAPGPSGEPDAQPDDDRSQESDMESSHLSAETEPLAPNDSTVEPTASGGPDPTNTAYDVAIGRLLEHMCSQGASQRESRPVEMSDNSQPRSKSEQRAPMKLHVEVSNQIPTNTANPSPKTKDK